MSSLTTYNQLQVVTPDPTGTGGLAINNNFKNLSTHMAATDPTASNDSGQNYAMGSVWYNTATSIEWLCTDAAAGAAVWNKYPFILSPASNSAIQVDADGNARGAYAVDLQSVRGAVTQIASGACSLVWGGACTASGSYSTASGWYSTASGNYSIASGYFCTVSGDYSTASGGSSTATGSNSTASGYYALASGNISFAIGSHTTASGNFSHAWGYQCVASAVVSTACGSYSLASKRGQFALNSWSFANVSGDNQQTISHLLTTTTNATQTELTTNHGAPSGTTEPTSNRFVVAASKTYACFITLAARQDNGTSAMFVRQVVIKNVSGTVSLEGSVQTVGTDINPSSWGLTLQADNTNKALQVLVTGAASTNIRWRATVRADEIIY